MWYNNQNAGNGEADMGLRDARFTRTLSLVRRPALVVMAFDGNAWNWSNIAGSTGYDARISGRHGKPLNNGKDGWFNCASSTATSPSSPPTPTRRPKPPAPRTRKP